MKISQISQLNKVSVSKTNKENNFNYISSYNSANTINDKIIFTSKNVVENLIITDVNNYIVKNYNNFSNNLKRLVDKTVIISKLDTSKTAQHIIENKELNSYIKFEIGEKYKDIKSGFIVGKTGFYATLEVPTEKGIYSIIIPENSEIQTGDGLHVINAKKPADDKGLLSFKGKTATVNAYYRPEKTINGIKKFIDMTQNSPIFKNISKATKDYSEKFHPYILAGGFGSRLEAISYGRGDNKPSTATPIKDWNLVNFSLLNLFQANLFDKETDVNYVIQTEANSAVGCFITTLGYKIGMTPDGLDLIKEGESVLPPNKAVVILPSDNITDVNLSEALDAYMQSNNVGMMVVGVPDYRCYGGLIRYNENDEIKEFITKPSAELLAKGDDYIYYTDQNGEKQPLIDSNGYKTSLGNAFIYLINPEILDSITDIYRNKIKTAYKELMDTKGSVKTMTDEEYLKVIESFWDREIIPQLVELSNKGELKNKNGDDLKILTHRAMNTYWSDVGEYSSYYTTIKNAAREDAYVSLPEPIKQELRKNIQDNVIFNVDVKDEFNKMLGQGFVKGNIIVIPKD